MNIDRQIEILSPAGTLSCLKAAVMSGADAVYFGGQMFNARKNAGNFDKEQIAEAVRLCRLFGVRTHLTVNTSVKEKELPALYEFLDETLPLGLDAVIVQDPAVAMYIARNYPEVELHASTQMAVTDLNGVRLMEELGYTRVVLARELDLDEIRHIRENTKMELEVFIHGALCYSYSGRCLLSSFHGGRSGNRGACAQPCRLEYLCQVGDDRAVPGHFMNLKDREGYSHFQELLDMGIESFKIEGRMKSEAYVAGVTKFYHDLKEEYLRTGKIEEPSEERILELKQLFNRGGFTDGYFTGKEGMVEKDHPKNQGLSIGSVTRVDRDRVTITATKELHPGDELEIEQKKGRGRMLASVRLSGTMIEGQKKASFYVKEASSIRPGDDVRRIVDPVLNDRILSGLSYPSIPLTIEGTARAGEPVTWRAEAGGISTTLTEEPPLIAQNRPTDEAAIRKQMERLGDTPFNLEGLTLTLGEDIFLPASRLNQTRRELTGSLIRALEERRIGRGRTGLLHQPLKEERTVSASPVRIELSVENEQQLLAAERWFEAQTSLQPYYYLSMEGWMGRNKSDVLSIIDPERLVIRLPLKALDRMQRPVEKEIGEWMSLDVTRFEAAFPGQILLIRSLGGSALLGPEMGVWNRRSCECWSRFCERQAISRELSLSEIRDLRDPAGLSLVIYGRIPYMITEQCPVRECASCRKKNDRYELTDRKQEKIKGFSHCSFCYQVLYSERPVSISKVPGYLKKILSEKQTRPAEGLRLEFTDEPDQEMIRVLEFFLKESPMPDMEWNEGHFRKEVM